MQLILEDGSTWHFPNQSSIRNALAQVDGIDNGFIILEDTEMTYMQAAGSVDEGFTVEYQIEHTSQHYQAQDICSYEQTVTLFEYYARNDPEWHSMVEWELIEV